MTPSRVGECSLASSIASELVLQAAVWTTVTFALAAALVVAWVSVERARNTRIRSRRLAAEQRWRELLAGCIDAPEPLALPAPQVGERGALLSVWADYHELLSGSGVRDRFAPPGDRSHGGAAAVPRR